MSEKKWPFKESTKLNVDYLKHITTLATGSIILLVTFLDKVFEHPNHTWMIIVVLISLLLTVVFASTSFISLGIAYQAWEEGREPKDWIDSTAGICFLLSYFSFVAGLFFFTVFSISNLNTLT